METRSLGSTWPPHDPAGPPQFSSSISTDFSATMGLGYLLSRLVGASVVFAYPIYASYKAIRSNDPALLETWLMYWIVIGVIVALESTVEWLVTWLPFYYFIKTAFLVWLSLPQIQGSTYVYLTYVHPFLETHEVEIDAAAVQAKSRAKSMGLEYVRRIWSALLSQATGNMAVQEPPSESQQPPPSNLTSTLLQQYGSSAIAATSALLNPMQTQLGRRAHAEAESNNLSHTGDQYRAPWSSSSSSSSTQNASLGAAGSRKTNTPSPHPENGFEYVSPGEAAGYSIDGNSTPSRNGNGQTATPATSLPWRIWPFGGATPAAPDSKKTN